MEAEPEAGPTPAPPPAKGAPPAPSPLTGCYLLVVVAEPHSGPHKDIILQRIAKGLLSWDIENCHVDLEKELQAIASVAPEGEEARHGERLIQFATENLVTEVLIHPAANTLMQCMKNLLSSFTRHRHIIHAGYSFGGNGSWSLQDGTFSLIDFAEAFQEHEVQRVLRAYENTITIDIHCSTEGDWTRLPKETFAKTCRLRVNPNDVLTSGSPSINNFLDYLSPFLVPADIESLLESSDVVGNIRFSHPTLYVFPGGQGDAALFGINGFNMLVDGGYARKACFWDFTRHLDRLDAVLVTRINNSNICGISAVLKRKTNNQVYPQIGHFFCNIQERKAISPDGDKDKDPLQITLLDEGQEITSNLRQLNLRPQACYRDADPINLYHKVGHGTLDMYVLSPAKDSKEVKDFLQKWNANDQKLFATRKELKEFSFPLPNLVSICALLVWQPANPSDTITRLLFPGSTPQHKIFEGLDKLRHLEFTKHPVCSAKSLTPSGSILGLAKTKQIKAATVLDKILPSEQKSQKILDSKPFKEKIALQNENKQKSENKTLSQTENKKLNGINEENKISTQIEKVIKTDSIESEKSEPGSEPKKPEVNGKDVVIILEDKSEVKQKPKIIDTKSKVENKQKISARSRNESQPRKSFEKKPKTEKRTETKPTPTTPKKSSVNGGAKERDLPKTKLMSRPSMKSSPTSTPAKSTKDANNRKVVESKYKPAVRKEVSKVTTEKKEPVKIERKPISRRPKAASPARPTKTSGSPSKKLSGVKMEKDGVSRAIKLEKEGTTDSSAVSTPSADQDLLKKIDVSKLSKTELEELKAKELADLKEEQEAVKEIEAVFRKNEVPDKNDQPDLRKIKEVSIEEKTTEAEEEDDEYLIVEKEEIEQNTDSVNDQESGTKEDEIHKLQRDSQESEKRRKGSDADNTVDDIARNEEEKIAKEIIIPESKLIETETCKVLEIIPPKIKEEDTVVPTEMTRSKEDSRDKTEEMSKEISVTSPEDKIDISSEKKFTDTRDVEEEDQKGPIDQNVLESQPDEKFSATIESGATTAPTLPEDERIPLDEIKEDQVIEEKYVKEETKEKEIPAVVLPQRTFETIPKINPIIGMKFDTHQTHIRDIVKTPDEVADLPVHEEVDIDTYDFPGAYKKDELKKVDSLDIKSKEEITKEKEQIPSEKELKAKIPKQTPTIEGVEIGLDTTHKDIETATDIPKIKEEEVDKIEKGTDISKLPEEATEDVLEEKGTTRFEKEEKEKDIDETKAEEEVSEPIVKEIDILRRAEKEIEIDSAKLNEAEKKQSQDQIEATRKQEYIQKHIKKETDTNEPEEKTIREEVMEAVKKEITEEIEIDKDLSKIKKETKQDFKEDIDLSNAEKEAIAGLEEVMDISKSQIQTKEDMKEKKDVIEAEKEMKEAIEKETKEKIQKDIDILKAEKEAKADIEKFIDISKPEIETKEKIKLEIDLLKSEKQTIADTGIITDIFKSENETKKAVKEEIDTLKAEKQTKAEMKIIVDTSKPEKKTKQEEIDRLKSEKETKADIEIFIDTAKPEEETIEDTIEEKDLSDKEEHEEIMKDTDIAKMEIEIKTDIEISKTKKEKKDESEDEINVPKPIEEAKEEIIIDSYISKTEKKTDVKEKIDLSKPEKEVIESIIKDVNKSKTDLESEEIKKDTDEDIKAEIELSKSEKQIREELEKVLDISKIRTEAINEVRKDVEPHQEEKEDVKEIDIPKTEKDEIQADTDMKEEIKKEFGISKIKKVSEEVVTEKMDQSRLEKKVEEVTEQDIDVSKKKEETNDEVNEDSELDNSEQEVKEDILKEIDISKTDKEVSQPEIVLEEEIKKVQVQKVSRDEINEEMNLYKPGEEEKEVIEKDIDISEMKEEAKEGIKKPKQELKEDIIKETEKLKTEKEELKDKKEVKKGIKKDVDTSKEQKVCGDEIKVEMDLSKPEKEVNGVIEKDIGIPKMKEETQDEDLYLAKPEQEINEDIIKNGDKSKAEKEEIETKKEVKEDILKVRKVPRDEIKVDMDISKPGKVVEKDIHISKIKEETKEEVKEDKDLFKPEQELKEDIVKYIDISKTNGEAREEIKDITNGNVISKTDIKSNEEIELSKSEEEKDEEIKKAIDFTQAKEAVKEEIMKKIDVSKSKQERSEKSKTEIDTAKQEKELKKDSIAGDSVSDEIKNLEQVVEKDVVKSAVVPDSKKLITSATDDAKEKTVDKIIDDKHFEEILPDTVISDRESKEYILEPKITDTKSDKKKNIVEEYEEEQKIPVKPTTPTKLKLEDSEKDTDTSIAEEVTDSDTSKRKVNITKIITSVAHVLKSDAPLEELAPTLPPDFTDTFTPFGFKTYTTELRETHITTLDSPVRDDITIESEDTQTEISQIETDISPKKSTASFLEQERKSTEYKISDAETVSKEKQISDLIQDSKELIESTSKIICDIKSSSVIDSSKIDESQEESEKTSKGSEQLSIKAVQSLKEEIVIEEALAASGTVHRMLVTASSEDGGEETVICPTGSIKFVRSESSGQLSPDNTVMPQILSERSSPEDREIDSKIPETISLSKTDTEKLIEKSHTESDQKKETVKMTTSPPAVIKIEDKHDISDKSSELVIKANETEKLEDVLEEISLQEKRKENVPKEIIVEVKTEATDETELEPVAILEKEDDKEINTHKKLDTESAIEITSATETEITNTDIKPDIKDEIIFKVKSKADIKTEQFPVDMQSEVKYQEDTIQAVKKETKEIPKICVDVKDKIKDLENLELGDKEQISFAVDVGETKIALDTNLQDTGKEEFLHDKTQETTVEEGLQSELKIEEKEEDEISHVEKEIKDKETDLLSRFEDDVNIQDKTVIAIDTTGKEADDFLNEILTETDIKTAKVDIPEKILPKVITDITKQKATISEDKIPNAIEDVEDKETEESTTDITKKRAAKEIKELEKPLSDSKSDSTEKIEVVEKISPEITDEEFNTLSHKIASVVEGTKISPSDESSSESQVSKVEISSKTEVIKMKDKSFLESKIDKVSETQAQEAIKVKTETEIDDKAQMEEIPSVLKTDEYISSTKPALELKSEKPSTFEELLDEIQLKPKENDIQNEILSDKIYSKKEEETLESIKEKESKIEGMHPEGDGCVGQKTSPQLTSIKTDKIEAKSKSLHITDVDEIPSDVFSKAETEEKKSEAIKKTVDLLKEKAGEKTKESKAKVTDVEKAKPEKKPEIIDDLIPKEVQDFESEKKSQISANIGKDIVAMDNLKEVIQLQLSTADEKLENIESGTATEIMYTQVIDDHLIEQKDLKDESSAEQIDVVDSPDNIKLKLGAEIIKSDDSEKQLKISSVPDTNEAVGDENRENRKIDNNKSIPVLGHIVSNQKECKDESYTSDIISDLATIPIIATENIPPEAATDVAKELVKEIPADSKHEDKNKQEEKSKIQTRELECKVETATDIKEIIDVLDSEETKSELDELLTIKEDSMMIEKDADISKDEKVCKPVEEGKPSSAIKTKDMKLKTEENKIDNKQEIGKVITETKPLSSERTVIEQTDSNMSSDLKEESKLKQIKEDVTKIREITEEIGRVKAATDADTGETLKKSEVPTTKVQTIAGDEIEENAKEDKTEKSTKEKIDKVSLISDIDTVGRELREEGEKFAIQITLVAEDYLPVMVTPKQENEQSGKETLISRATPQSEDANIKKIELVTSEQKTEIIESKAVSNELLDDFEEEIKSMTEKDQTEKSEFSKLQKEKMKVENKYEECQQTFELEISLSPTKMETKSDLDDKSRLKIDDDVEGYDNNKEEILSVKTSAEKVDEKHSLDKSDLSDEKTEKHLSETSVSKISTCIAEEKMIEDIVSPVTSSKSSSEKKTEIIECDIKPAASLVKAEIADTTTSKTSKDLSETKVDIKQTFSDLKEPAATEDNKNVVSERKGSSVNGSGKSTPDIKTDSSKTIITAEHSGKSTPDFKVDDTPQRSTPDIKSSDVSTHSTSDIPERLEGKVTSGISTPVSKISSGKTTPESKEVEESKLKSELDSTESKMSSIMQDISADAAGSIKESQVPIITTDLSIAGPSHLQTDESIPSSGQISPLNKDLQHLSSEDLHLSGKSTPDIADVERMKEIHEILKHEKHIPGSSTPPTVPVSPIVKESFSLQSDEPKITESKDMLPCKGKEHSEEIIKIKDISTVDLDSAILDPCSKTILDTATTVYHTTITTPKESEVMESELKVLKEIGDISKVDAEEVTMTKTTELHCSTPGSDEYELGDVSSPHSDISSGQMSRVAHAWGHGSSEERQAYSDDEDIPGSPTSVTSQMAHSPPSHFTESELDTGETIVIRKSIESDPMNTSVYGSLPEDITRKTSTPTRTSLDTKTQSQPIPIVSSIKPEHEYPKTSELEKHFLGEADIDFEKALLEHRQTKHIDSQHSGPLDSSSHKYEITTAKFSHVGTRKGVFENGKDGIPLKEINKNGYDKDEGTLHATHSIKTDSPKKSSPEIMTSSFIEETTSTSSSCPASQESKKDPIESWGKPLGLPSPALPPTSEMSNKTTPKKVPPSATLAAKNKINDERRRSDSPLKYDKKTKKMNPVYMDLTYVPHHGNSYYSFVEFFKRVRARYYVFSGTEPSKNVYNALLEAKQTWEDKDLEVTIIPTYDTDVLGYWVAENEDLLAKYKIDLSPSASRCTINLQDHETSCSAYRLEF